MSTPDSPSPDRPSPALPWAEVWLLTVWFGLPILIASIVLIEEIDLVSDAWRAANTMMRDLQTWLETTANVPPFFTALMDEGPAFIWANLLLVFLLGYRLRRHPRTIAIELRLLFVLLIAVIAMNWHGPYEGASTYAHEYREWLRVSYPDDIRHSIEFAWLLETHGCLLFYAWAAATAGAATFALEWRVTTRLAEQRSDGGRRLRLLQTLTQNTPPPIIGIFSMLSLATIPLALALLFMSAPKNQIWETHLDVPFVIGNLPANDPHPVLPLAIQADGTVRVGDSTLTFHPVEQLPILREFVKAHQIDTTQMKVTLRIAPESTLQQMISVMDDLKQVGFHVLVFLD